MKLSDVLEKFEIEEDIEAIDLTVLNRMIKYLKSAGWDAKQIVDLLEYIAADESEK